jgi:hypothetical protein
MILSANFQVTILLLAYYVKEKCVLLKLREISYDNIGVIRNKGGDRDEIQLLGTFGLKSK